MKRYPGNSPSSLFAEDEERQKRVAVIRQACDAIVDLTIMFGGSPATAYQVAAELAYGLEDPDRRPRRFKRNGH